MVWVVIAIAFAAVWVYALYREDIRNPEPLWLVALAIAGGVLALVVASRIEARLTPDMSLLDGPLRTRAAIAYLVAGPVEETIKFVAVALIVWFQSHFDEPMDGIVYAAAAGAGFACAENLLFMQEQPSIVLARGPVATGAHILFAAFWGGALGHAKQMRGPWSRAAVLTAGLVLASTAHGTFDLITWSVDKELSLNQARIAQIVLIVACFLFLRWRIKVALQTASVLQHASVNLDHVHDKPLKSTDA